MKYSYFIPVVPFLFFEMIHSFIGKFFICEKMRGIVKSLSGLLQKLPFINRRHIEPNSIIRVPCDNVCDSAEQMIIPGYMDHDPMQNPVSRVPTKWLHCHT